VQSADGALVIDAPIADLEEAWKSPLRW
jgi:hypothetical protein